jgi:hypothetical protein
VESWRDGACGYGMGSWWQIGGELEGWSMWLWDGELVARRWRVGC